MFKQVDYSETEREYRNILIENMRKAKDQRDQGHDEFNGMTYEEWWEENAKVRNGYKEPKQNANEVRITSGTVMEKANSIVSSLESLNLEPNIEAYDEMGSVVEHAGNLMEDLVKKSNEIEEPTYEEKELRIIDEFVTQGTLFTEETTKEFTIPQKTIKDLDISEIDKITWEEGIEKYYRYCDTHLLIGLNVYLGNIKEPFIRKQPFVYTRKLIPREEARAMYGNWSRWNNVPLEKENFNQEEHDSLPFNNWTLGQFDERYVEEINFLDKWNNNWMKLLNGVMMFPVKKSGKKYSTMPLSAILGVCEYNIAKGDYESMPHFAYSRSVPSKNITDQALFDEFLKSMIIKTRQSYDPPVANQTGEELGDDIFYSGTIWDDVDPDKITPLIETTGVTPAEFNMSKFLRGIIDEKSVSSTFQGQSEPGNQTATEIANNQRQSVRNMAMAVNGLVGYNKQRTALRIFNILNTWTLPERLKDSVIQMVDEYKTITVDTTLEEGDGRRIIEFTEDLPSEAQAQAESRVLSKVIGQRIQKDYVNPVVLKKALRYFWKITIVPTPKSDTALRVAQFSEFVKNAMAMSQALGIQLNGEELLRRMAVLNEEDPDKIISEQPALPQGLPQGAPQGGVNAQLQPKQQPQPSVNTLANQ
jgi:hypothetical protein